jgi:hypothetical protein
MMGCLAYPGLGRSDRSTTRRPAALKRWSAFFVSDASGAIFIAMSSLLALPFTAGDLVDVTSVSATGDYAPIVCATGVRLLGKSRFPQIALSSNLATLSSGDERGRWLELEGVVHVVPKS